ncbi:hypothetical protein Clacol_001213 [Clathrus columnatus]|uniref:Uncharacterized protein n=1 Tax=Clathrus columnatus TaxID=1419009 RepID=A0AAV5A540_9AGAM|nr:hypothetical protein Clacol_001213 [Clathrus columnatus]
MTSTSTQTQAELIQSLTQVIPITVGACLLGTFLAAVFYGVTLLQTYQYFNRYYGHDSIYLFTLVPILTLLDTLATILNMVAMYFYLIKNFGNSLVLLHFNRYIPCSFVVTLVVSFLVQSVYPHRAYILSGRKLLIPAIILVFGLAGFILGQIFSACTLLALIFGGALKYTSYDIIPYFLLSKCNVNSVLAFLNSREHLRNSENNVVSFHLDSTSPATPKLETMSNLKSMTDTPSELGSTKSSSLSTIHYNNKMETLATTTSQTLDFPVNVTATDDVPEALNPPKQSV